MGTGLYKQTGGTIDLVISRKTVTTDGTYLHQYRINGGAAAKLSLKPWVAATQMASLWR